MLQYLWPVMVIIGSNVFYQICAKSVPDEMNPLASLTITYVVAAIISLILYYALNRDANIAQEYTRTNWAPFLLGVVIIGLEAGYIYAFKVGWPVSVTQIIQAAVVAVIMIIVGYLVFQEKITWNKVLGIVICLAGLGLINMK